MIFKRQATESVRFRCRAVLPGAAQDLLRRKVRRRGLGIAQLALGFVEFQASVVILGRDEGRLLSEAHVQNDHRLGEFVNGHFGIVGFRLHPYASILRG